MITLVNALPVIRPARTRSDKEQIDMIRAPYYGGFPLIDDPAIRYVVCERHNAITACYGLKVEGNRALVIDFYGTNAHDWELLCSHLLQQADKLGIELSAWIGITNKHKHWFEKKGFKDEATLVRRQPQGSAKWASSIS